MEKFYNVTNRSSGVVVYSIPEMNISRNFASGETKRIGYAELEKLTYQPGGQSLLNNYLQIFDADAINNLNIPTEPEYFMTAEQVKNMLFNGTLDELLDSLDFAPEGVIDLIKDIAVYTPLTDMVKIKAIKDKTGYDVEAAIRHLAEEKADNGDTNTTTEVKTRRVQTKPVETTQERRTSGDKYIIPNK